MTKKKQPTKQKPPKPEKHPFVVFGLDPTGKPKGARFQAEQFELAADTCTSMNLQFHEASSPELLELSKKLPSGRIYARGRAFVPFIKRELYDKLHVASGGLVRDRADASPTAPVPSGPPRNWKSIEPGHVVLAKSAIEDEGYFEAIVLSRENDKLKLKYRDYPAEKPIERPLSSIALLNPGPDAAK